MSGDHLTRQVAACPACGCKAYTAQGAPAAAFPCDGTRTGLCQPAYEIRQCRECALFFKSHMVTPVALARYYSSLDFAPFNLPHEFPTDKKLLATLRQRPPGSRVLDYGCSTGRILSKLGEGYRRFGVEVNAQAAGMAGRRGIIIVTESDLIEDRVGAFHAIVLADVFEHLVEPTATMRLLASRLESGGQLLIVTGLADAIRPCTLMSEHWYFRICGHLHMLSLEHLNWLGRTLRLEVTAVTRMSHYQRSSLRLARQMAQARLYRLFRMAPQSRRAAVLRRLPLLSHAARWTSLPATDQLSDHVVAVLAKS